MRSKPVVMVAVLPSMTLAEQYLSWLMAIARSTAKAGMLKPAATTKARSAQRRVSGINLENIR